MRIRHLDPSQSRFTKSSGFRRSHHMGFKSDLQFSHSCFALHYGAASAHFPNGIEGMREDDARRKGGMEAFDAARCLLRLPHQYHIGRILIAPMAKEGGRQRERAKKRRVRRPKGREGFKLIDG